MQQGKLDFSSLSDFLKASFLTKMPEFNCRIQMKYHFWVKLGRCCLDAEVYNDI